MFIISLTYKKDISEIERLLPEHVLFLEKNYKANRFICTGRKNPRVGGIILATNSTLQKMEDIIKEDPFYINDVADYQITEFTPTKYDERFLPFI